VTWYSKAAAVVVFLATFVIAFNLGILWEQAHIGGALVEVQTPASETASTTAGIQIEGGAGAHCGGLIRNAPVCASGFHCQLDANRPDTGGTCVADK